MLLAACGGGGNLTTSSQPEPEPPVIGPLVPSSEGDGEQQKIIVIQQEEPEEDQQNEESEEIIDIIIEQPEEEEKEEENQETKIQQITIIEEEEEQQKIVVNVQPPEDSNDDLEEEEEESESNNDGETPQQLTIIEEPEPTYIPPAKEKPRYSAQTACSGTCQTGTLHSYSYWLDVPNTPGASIIAENTKFASSGRSGSNYNFPDGSVAIKARYHKANGFVAKYDYEDNTGTFTSDVDLLFNYPKNGQPTIRGILGHDIFLESTKYGNYNFGSIMFDATIDPDTGTFNAQPQFSIFSNSYMRFKTTDESGYELQGSTYVFVERITVHPNIRVIPDLSGTIHESGQTKVIIKPNILEHNSFKPTPGVISGNGSVRGSFSNDGTTGNNKAALPGQLAGEVEIKDFRIIGGSETGNRLVGVFVGDKR